MTVDACDLHTEPWVPLAALDITRHDEHELVIRCPERLYCLRGALVIGGRIAPHFRNVAGLCPWIEVGVRDAAPPCGCEPFITTRQLRIVIHHGGIPWGPIASIACPGGCPEFAPVRASRIGPHGYRPCPWTGIRVVKKGLYPPLLTAEDFQ